MSNRNRQGKRRKSKRKEKGPSSLLKKRVSFNKRVENLVKQMQIHLAGDSFLNMSIPPHSETTEALHRLVYMGSDPGKLKIEYNDGSKGKPFPVGGVWKPDEGWNWHPKQKQHVHIGTLSFRHVDYDKHVDVYLIRDAETRRLLQAEVEELAYGRMKEILEASQLKGESYVSVYQTGLEPLVVGVYRALTEHLQQRNSQGLGPMRIQPIFYLDNETGRQTSGTIWGTGMS